MRCAKPTRLTKCSAVQHRPRWAVRSTWVRKQSSFVKEPSPKVHSLTTFWAPTDLNAARTAHPVYKRLIEAGFLRKAHNGVFHMLPLGLRVQRKIEGLIEKHMDQLGASKVSMGCITSEELWRKSGRFNGNNPELYRLATNQGNTGMLLGPTHEEEITSLVGSMVQSYKDLPLRLYQISTKFRNELRPRHGLIRTSEFLMKDLYTFDATTEASSATYQVVKSAYEAFFTELQLPYLVTAASSGDMGGSMSHEFQVPWEYGEDEVVFCGSCSFAENTEVTDVGSIRGKIPQLNSFNAKTDLGLWIGAMRAKEQNQLLVVAYPKRLPNDVKYTLNTSQLQRLFPQLDLSVDNAIERWKTYKTGAHGEDSDGLGQGPLHLLIDTRIPSDNEGSLDDVLRYTFQHLSDNNVTAPGGGPPMNFTGGSGDFLSIQDGEACPRCRSGTLQTRRAIELGHTFNLGTRYTQPLGATVELPDSMLESDTGNNRAPLLMGCHGIGVTRLIGTIAAMSEDTGGLNWPRVIAPFQVVIIVSSAERNEVGRRVCDMITRLNFGSIDAVVDDREKPMSWKLKDADLIGYPVVIVVGKKWEKDRMLELKCRRVHKEPLFVKEGSLNDEISALLQQC